MNRFVLFFGIFLGASLCAQADSSTTNTPPDVQGVRGLEETHEPVDTALRDYPGVDKLAAIAISPPDLKKFIEEGGLK